MNIVLIENNQVVTQAILPPAIMNVSNPSLAKYRELTGQDWREYVAPAYDPQTQSLGAWIVGETVTRSVGDKTAEELEEIRIAAIPYEITMRQARIMLARSGLLSVVDATVAAIGGEAQIVWEYSSMVQRNNPLVAAVAAQAGFTERQLDDLFTAAKDI